MRMEYFSATEFRGQKGLMYPRLLVMMDVLRHMWGRPIDISPAPGALGRMSGTSMHNYVLWKSVFAVDLMPRGLDRRSDAERFLDICRALGFTGIGYYPHWMIGEKRRPGFHVDVRQTHAMGYPAIWGGVREGSSQGIQQYVSMDQALALGPNAYSLMPVA